MKKSQKVRIFSIFLTSMMVLGLLFTPTQTLKTEAATKKYMKNMDVKWDLKNNKKSTFKSCFVKVGMEKKGVKITNYKIQDAKKKGYKQLSFTMTVSNEWKPSNSEIHTIAKTKEYKNNQWMGGGFWFTFLDYDTGKTLDENNNKNVTIKEGKWKTVSTQKYKDKDGCTIKTKTVSMKVIVTYPKSYKGLCFGIGGNKYLTPTENDIAFWDGKKAFGKTSYYTKNKTNCHFIRVTK